MAFSALTLLAGLQEGHPACKKTVVGCFSKIQIGFTFLVQAHPGSPGQRAIKRVCACVYAVRYNNHNNCSITTNVPLIRKNSWCKIL